MSILYITYAIAGIGLIIFIHECGHFFAAKKVGVRVERFALGFDPVIRGRRLKLWSMKRGDTEYVLGMIPFGGYVKMAGEMIADPDDETPPKPDELLAKSVGARALVFVAGAVMNLLSAFVFFMIAFTIGTPFIDTQLGTIEPGSEAWKQGLEPGDRIVAIGGEPIVDFYELVINVALSGKSDTLDLRISRAEETDTNRRREFDLVVKPSWDAAQERRRIGVSPATNPTIEKDPAESNPSYSAGLRKGQRLIGARIDGKELPPLDSSLLVDAISSEFGLWSGSRSIDLHVANPDGTDRWLSIKPRRKEKPGELVRLARIGARGYGSVVRAIHPESSARDHLKSGDHILKIDGRPVAVVYWQNLLALQGKQTELTVRNADGVVRSINIPASDLILWDLRNEIEWATLGVRVGKIKQQAPAETPDALRPDDVITHVQSRRVYDLAGLTEAIDDLNKGSGSEAISIRLRRDGENRVIKSTLASWQAHADGITWNTVPPLTTVHPSGPAGTIGIESGSRISSFRGKEIFTFEEFREAVSQAPLAEKHSISWIDAAGIVKSGRLEFEPDAFEAFSLGSLKHQEKIVQVGFLESFPLGVKRSIHIGKQVFLTLRSLIRRDVSAKHLSGPIGITHVFTRAAESGWARLIYFMAMVSVNLGLLNLMPFPILDGGHLVFLLIEKIKGSPVSLKLQEIATSVAFFLIISLFLFVTFHDIKRILPF